MEIANSSVPVAAVSYQKFSFFLTVTQLAEVTAVKIHNMTLLWDRLCLLQRNFVTAEDSKSLLMS
jgi:hypothetical protein